MKECKKINLSFVLALIFLLFLSIIYNIKLKTQLNEFLIKQNIEGTFIMVEDGYESEYFVFERGNFYRYKQFELLDNGMYENYYDDIYILESNNERKYIIFNSKKLYFYDSEQNSVLLYSKISNTPTFINIEIEKWQLELPLFYFYI